MTRGRRGALMLGLAAVCAGLAASSMDRYADDVAAQIGPLQPVVVAAEGIPRGTLITPAVARTALAQRRVPLRFAPPQVLSGPRDALGYRTLTTVAPGDYLDASQLGRPRSSPRPYKRGSGRLVEVPVTGARGIAAALRPGGYVDVLVTTDGEGAAPRTYLALQRLELIDFREAGNDGGDGARATATLRTTLRQAVTLTAAQNFAREVRVVPRATGDVRRLGRTVVNAASLGR